MNGPTDEQKELLVKFVEQHVVFFDSYFNWITILLVLGILFSIVLLFKKVKRWIVRIPVFMLQSSILVIIVLFALLINGPLKPFINSIATIHRSINSIPTDFEFRNVRTGQTTPLSEYKNKVVLINFWGTYCGPCIEEMPELKRLEEAYPDKLIVVALSDESDEKIQTFLERHDAPSIVGSFVKEEWISLGTFRPLSIYIDKSGAVREYFFGKENYEGFKNKALKYL